MTQLAVYSDAPPRRRLGSSPATIAALAVMSIAAAWPVLSVGVPLMSDLPNHLARVYALAWLDQDKLLAQYFSTEWRIVPNLAADALMPALAHAVSIYAAGKAFVLLVAALTVGGTWALHRALHRRPSFWPLASFVLLYNFVFLLGFLNYLFGAALALWATASWIALRRAAPIRRAAASMVFVLALFLSHFLAVGLYGLAVLSYELWRLADRRPKPRRLLRNAAVFGLPFLLVPALLLLSPTSGHAGETSWRFWPFKLDGLYYAVKSYSLAADAGFALVVAASVALGLATRRLRFHPVAWIYLPLAALAYAAIPETLGGAELVDVRLPASFAFFALAFSDWRAASERGRQLAIAAIAAIAVFRAATVAAYWHGYDATLAEMRRSFDDIEPGSRVLVAVNPDGARLTDKIALRHLPALVTIERSSLASVIFSQPGKQPLRVKPPYAEAMDHDGRSLMVADLAAADRGDESPAASTGAMHKPEQPYWRRWRDDYDYLYVLFTPDGWSPPVGGIEPLYRTSRFALYRIDPAG